MVERAHLAPFLYFALVDIDPKKGEEFYRWLSSVHIKDVIGNPGFLWARRIPLDQTAEDGWKRVIVMYGINTREEYLVYRESEAFKRYQEELKQFAGVYRTQRLFGQVDLAFD